jgi:hypothetical protein
MGIKKSKKLLLCKFQDMKCERCKQEFILGDLQVHRLNRGGSYEDHRNLMVLCRKDHKRLHENEWGHVKGK